MDKYGLSNETRAAEDDSSALYHMLLCGSGVAVGGEEVDGMVCVCGGGLFMRRLWNLSVSSLSRGWLSVTMVVFCERK